MHEEGALAHVRADAGGKVFPERVRGPRLSFAVILAQQVRRLPVQVAISPKRFLRTCISPDL